MLNGQIGEKKTQLPSLGVIGEDKFVFYLILVSFILIPWFVALHKLRWKPPDVGSPAFLQAQVEALNILVPPIASWYNSLPDNKKYAPSFENS